MALKVSYDKKEDVPEEFKALYIEKNGKFVLDADIEDTSGLKSALEKERQEKKDAKAALAKWTKIGDPDKAEAALLKLQEIEEEEAKRAGKWDELKAQLIQKHEEQTKTLKTEMATKDKAVEKLVVDNAVITAVTAAKGKVKVLLPHVKQFVKSVLEDGEYKAVVVDAKGVPRIGDDKGTAMTIDQLVAEFAKDPDYMPNFEASGTSGGGAASQQQGAARQNSGSTVKIGDQSAMNSSLEDIATGKVSVTD